MGSDITAPAIRLADQVDVGAAVVEVCTCHAGSVWGRFTTLTSATPPSRVVRPGIVRLG